MMKMEDEMRDGWKEWATERLMFYQSGTAIIRGDDCYRYIEKKLETKCVWGDEAEGAERQC